MANNYISPRLFLFRKGRLEIHRPLMMFVSPFVGYPQGNKMEKEKKNNIQNPENKALPAFPLFVEDNKRRQPKKESQIKG